MGYLVNAYIILSTQGRKGTQGAKAKITINYLILQKIIEIRCSGFITRTKTSAPLRPCLESFDLSTLTEYPEWICHRPAPFHPGIRENPYSGRQLNPQPWQKIPVPPVIYPAHTSRLPNWLLRLYRQT